MPIFFLNKKQTFLEAFKNTMDLMLLDAHFADSLPDEVLGGDIERCEIGESESTNEARLFLFAKDLSGISYCLTILGYKPWIRIMNRSGQASKSSLESLLSAAFNIDKSAISIVEEKKPQFYGYAPGNGTNPKNWLCYKIYFPTLVGCFPVLNCVPLTW